MDPRTPPAETAKPRLPGDQYRVLVEHAPTMIWRAGVDAKCSWFNDTWLEFTGRRLEEELGDGWLEGVHPDDLERCVDLYLHHFGRREPFEIEYRLRRADGVYRWILDRGAPFFSEEDGSFGGFIGSCIDVDERRRSDEAKSRFLVMIAHELRTPLTPLTAYVHELERLLVRGDRVPQDLAERIGGQTARLVELAAQIAEAGSIDSSLVRDLDFEDVDLGALLAEVVHDRRQRLARTPTNEARPRLALELPESSPVVRVDRARFKQALEAILSNAVKFSPSGGEVAVRVSSARDAVRIEVLDRGIGVPEAELSRLGTAYFRATNAPLANYPGVGLGLARAKRTLRAHGGALAFQSTPGKGTRVTLSIPRAKEARSA